MGLTSTRKMFLLLRLSSSVRPPLGIRAIELQGNILMGAHTQTINSKEVSKSLALLFNLKR
jgi:hypothetical protein